MAELTLVIPDEDLETMLVPLKAYSAVPVKTDVDGKPLFEIIDGEEVPTGELMDDIPYVKHFLVSYLDRSVVKGTTKLGGAAAVAALDKDKIAAIKKMNAE